MDLFLDSHAVIDPSGRYRYRLDRRWGRGKRICFVMLNPSTADGEKDDPTVRRCLQIARAWKFEWLVVANLYAFRTASPMELFLAEDPIGPENNRWIMDAAVGSFVVCAWGDRAKPERVLQVKGLLSGIHLHCLGVTKAGNPRHPLWTWSNALSDFKLEEP